MVSKEKEEQLNKEFAAAHEDLNVKKENDAVINSNIAKIANAGIGDVLVLKNGDEEFKYNIVGINDSFMGQVMYVKRGPLALRLEDDEEVYNVKFTADDKYENMSSIDEEEREKIANIFSIEDLRDNLKNSEILGPSIGSIFKVKNKYHFGITIKYKKEDNLYLYLKKLLEFYQTNAKIKIDIDFNPISW